MSRADAVQLVALIRAMSPEDQAALAYDHASHGCPLDDAGAEKAFTGVECPVCDAPLPFDEPLAYGIGRDAT